MGGCTQDKGGASLGPEDLDGRDVSSSDTGDVGSDSSADGLDDSSSGDADSADTGELADSADGSSDGTSTDTDASGQDSTDTFGTDADDSNDSGSDAGDGSSDSGPSDPCPNGTLPATFGNELPVDGPWFDGQLGRCTPYAHVAVGARESTYRLEFIQLPADATVEVFTPHYFSTESPESTLEPIATLEPGSGLVRDLDFSPVYSGEVVIHVSRTDASKRADYEVRMMCIAECDKVTTRFPLVLLHGLFGTNSYLGVLDYWHLIPTAFDTLGLEYRISTAGLIRNSEQRAKIIGPYLEGVLAETGARKLNLLGHSQGGLDARIAASSAGTGLGDRIASITTVATPHLGIPIDLAGLLVLFGIQDFTERAAADFNATYLDDPYVDYYSWGGRTCGALEFRCLLETGGEVVDPFLSVFYSLIKLQGYENDGLVTVPSAHWGTYLGTIPADHMDEVGQIADPAGFGDVEPFNHRQFYVDEVYRLIESGY